VAPGGGTTEGDGGFLPPPPQYAEQNSTQSRMGLAGIMRQCDEEDSEDSEDSAEDGEGDDEGDEQQEDEEQDTGGEVEQGHMPINNDGMPVVMASGNLGAVGMGGFVHPYDAHG